jgi:magnesium chelatase subunit D
MKAIATPDPTPWSNAVRALTLFAVDPRSIGGFSVRARPGPVREVWMELLCDILPESTALLRVAHHTTDAGLLGGLDLAATLQSGRPVAQRGLLARADGGVIVLTSAERASPELAARIGQVLDTRVVNLQREGLEQRYSANIGLLMLDEGIDQERPPPTLLDRVGFHLDLDGVGLSDVAIRSACRKNIAEARIRLRQVEGPSDDVVRALCAAASALGIPSCRPILFAVSAARAAAALAGRSRVIDEDAGVAAALVFGPRATAVPAVSDTCPTPEHPPEFELSDGRLEMAADPIDRPLADVIVDAVQAAIPPGLLAELQIAESRLIRAPTSGRTGKANTSAMRRGRPAGVRQGEPTAGARINVIETLRAAAPWQALRRRERDPADAGHSRSQMIQIRRDDFRVTRRKHRTETTSIFAVDVSGSSALHRLAEAKGVVEQLLGDCYIRRDQVALLAFRGSGAELILPPTRSLVRAKRSLIGVPAGGGTPLAAAIDAAFELAVARRRKNQSPVIVLLTDGRANIARDGRPGRERAEMDALESAGAVRLARIATLVVDISPQPHAAAERLAARMGARYLPLPYADTKSLSSAVQAESRTRRGISCDF